MQFRREKNQQPLLSNDICDKKSWYGQELLTEYDLLYSKYSM